MYIIIVGAGEVGGYLARILIEERHDVAIIEANEDLCRDLDSSLDALVIPGNGISREALKRAGIDKADLLLAVTEIDEVNMITCMAAEKLGKQDLRTVARVRETRYLAAEGGTITTNDLGLDLLIGPEQAVASKVVELLHYEGTGEITHLANDQIVMLELPLTADSPMVHESLSNLRPDLPSPSLIAAVRGAKGLRIPGGEDTLGVDERAYVITSPENIDEFLIMSGNPWHHVRHVLIIGCGNIGFHVASQLEQQRLYPTIIERNHTRAEQVSKQLKKSIVLHGDGTDHDLIREQLEEANDAVVVLVEDDEKAMLIGLFAKHLGAKKVIVRSDQLDYTPIAHKMGLDALISPRRAVADAILRFVRRGPIASTVMLGDHEAEIIELTVPVSPKNEFLIRSPLKDITFPEGALLGAIIHEGRTTIPSGDTILQPGDRLLVVSLLDAIAGVEKLLQ